MTEKVAKFEKISLEQWHKDYSDDSSGIANKILEETIQIPSRSSKGSAGYDFVTPFDIDLKPNESVKIPTGLKCKIENGWFLTILSRSGLGFKNHLRTANVIPVIDSDYYYAENEGHIWVKIVNEGYTDLHIDAGKAFCQGVFLPYGITYDDSADGIRTGGLGSSGR